MQRVIIQFVIALGFFGSKALARDIEYQISGGGKSGKLLVNRDGIWRSMCYTVTNSGFDDDFADAACVYIGYHRSADIYPITLNSSTPDGQRPTICEILCLNYEAESLDGCDLTVAIQGTCNNCNEAVGITCTNSLSVEMIIGIVVALLILIGILFCTISCVFCCRSSPCYYKKSRTRTVVVTRRTPQVVTMMPTASANTTHQPPAYDVNSGYQPVPPTVTTAKY